MTEYGERLADYENAIARFTSTGHSHGPTMAERRAFVAARAADVGRRLPGDDIDLIANARKKSTMAMRFVFHLYGEPDGMKHDPPRFTSYEEFSRSVKRALQR
jgi:hypothetical protein